MCDQNVITSLYTFQASKATDAVKAEEDEVKAVGDDKAREATDDDEVTSGGEDELGKPVLQLTKKQQELFPFLSAMRTTTVPGISSTSSSSSRKEQPAAKSATSATSATSAMKQQQPPDEKKEEEKSAAAAASTRSRSQSPSVAVSPKVIDLSGVFLRLSSHSEQIISGRIASGLCNYLTSFAESWSD